MDLDQLLSYLTPIGAAALMAAAWVAPAHALDEPAPPALNADQVVARLEQKNQERAEALEHYVGHRRYHLEYHGFPGTKEATMEVNANFDAPASKRFTVTSETGSKLILNRVFRRLLESEQEATDANNGKRTALTTANYTFSLAGIDGTNYVLNVEPKEETKFLYRGKIWVDPNDFAVTKIEAEPAKNPSFWTTKSEIRHTYQKIDNFYLPKQNETVTNTRLGGVATLTIEYLSYDVIPSAKKETAAKTSAGAALEANHATTVGALVTGISH
ncbi:MAG TPA: hypothetical protein VGM27_02530 [Acidobacteriaceae bacterium]|jgi:hypothetical protein